MRRLFTWCSVALIAIGWQGEVQGQEACALDETIDGCFTRLMQVEHPSAAEIRSEEKSAAFALFQPGAISAGGQVQSTVTDLVPFLNALGLLSDSDASDGTLAFDLNFLIPVAEADRNSQLTWAINVKPEPFTPLIEAFAEDIRGQRASELGERIEDTGDSELQFTWSFVNKTFGRDFRQQSRAIDAMLVPILKEARKRADNRGRTARAQYLQALTKLDDALGDRLGSLPEPDDLGQNTFADLPADVRTDFMQSLATTASAFGVSQKAVDAQINSQLAETGTDQLARLVLQQPQLLFSASKQFRDELVGPEATSLKVTWEHSFANLGHFLRTTGSSCRASTLEAAADIATAAPCYTALRQYLEDRSEYLENEDRMAFSLEYRKFDAVTYAFPDDGLLLSVPKRDRLIGSVAYGRALPGTAARDRVDLKVDYDDAIDDEPNGQSRFVASLTYTRRIGELDIPFGIVYANKSEFIEGVDKIVSMHVGVKFTSGQ